MGIFNRKSKTKSLPQPEMTIDDYLDEYLLSLLNLSEAQINNEEKFNSYRALTIMEGFSEPENGEMKRQNNLVLKSSKMGYEHAFARNSKDPQKISFCQFSTVGYSIDDERTAVEKLYLNCDRDKVAEISKKLMKMAHKKKIPLTFKIAYEDGISDNYKRSDKIVIYTEEDNQKEAIIDILKGIDKKNKGIFNNKRVPLMPKVDGAEFICSPGKQKKGRKTNYFTVENVPVNRDNTWNALLADVLEESFVCSYETINGTYNPEKHKFFVSDGKKLSDYVQRYWKDIDNNKRNEIYQCMKYIMSEQCKKNKIMLDPNLKSREKVRDIFKTDLENGVNTYKEMAEKTQSEQVEMKNKSKDIDVMSY